MRKEYIPYYKQFGSLGHTAVKSKVAVIDPNITAYSTIPVTEPYDILIDNEVFWDIIQYIMDTPSVEIAGVGFIDENEEIVWAMASDIDSSSVGHVSSDSSLAIVEALQAGYGVPNLQWHTHPQMDAYFSGTDIRDQMVFIKGAMLANPDGGEHTFLVISELTWFISKIVWKDSKIIGRTEGYVVSNQVPLDFRRRVDEDSIGYFSTVPVAKVVGKYSPVLGDSEHFEWEPSLLEAHYDSLFSPADGGKDIFYDDYEGLFAIMNIKDGDWDALTTAINVRGLDIADVLDNRDLWEYLA